MKTELRTIGQPYQPIVVPEGAPLGSTFGGTLPPVALPAQPVDVTQEPSLVPQPQDIPIGQFVDSGGTLPPAIGGYVPMEAPPAAQPVSQGLASVGVQPRALPATQRPSAPSGYKSILRREEARLSSEIGASLANLDGALAEYDQKAQALTGVQQAGLNAQARGNEAQADAVARIQDSVEKQRMLDEGERLLENDEIAARQAKIDNAYTKLAQERVEDRRSPGQKMLSVISVAMSAVGDAMMAFGGAKGDNVARTMAVVDQQFQQMVDEQLRVINEKKGALSAKERSLQNFLSQVGDARAQRQFLIAQQYEDLKMMSEEIAQRTTSEVKRNAATELGAMADAKVAENRAAGAQSVAEDTRKRLQGLRDLGFEVELKQSLSAGKPKKGGAPYGTRAIDPSLPVDSEPAQKILSPANALISTIDKLRADASRGTSLGPTERQIAANRVMALRSQWNGVLGDKSAPNEAQLQALADAFMNPKEVSIQDNLRVYDALKQDAVDNTNASIRPYNITLETIDVRNE